MMLIRLQTAHQKCAEKMNADNGSGESASLTV